MVDLFCYAGLCLVLSNLSCLDLVKYGFLVRVPSLVLLVSIPALEHPAAASIDSTRGCQHRQYLGMPAHTVPEAASTDSTWGCRREGQWRGCSMGVLSAVQSLPAVPHLSRHVAVATRLASAPPPSAPIGCSFVSVSRLKSWGSSNAGWDGSLCNRFPVPVHTQLYTLPATSASAFRLKGFP